MASHLMYSVYEDNIVSSVIKGKCQFSFCACYVFVQELIQYYKENTLQNSFPELQTKLLFPFRDAAVQAAAAQPNHAGQYLCDAVSG